MLLRFTAYQLNFRLLLIGKAIQFLHLCAVLVAARTIRQKDPFRPLSCLDSFSGLHLHKRSYITGIKPAVLLCHIQFII